MNKKRLLQFFLTLHIPFSALAEAPSEEVENPELFFISHDQFMGLTPTEQLVVVKEIKDIVVQMSETYPDLSRELSARSSLLQQLWSMSMPPAIGAENTKKTSSSTKTSAEAPRYRCMIAGHIIKNDHCVPPRELPWDLNPFNEATFICSKGTIMCNPFIFGFSTDCSWETVPEKCWTSAKPYCVSMSKSATKSCEEASNTTKARQATVELIKRNPQAFNEFGKDFSSLCYKDQVSLKGYDKKRHAKRLERALKDIKETCKVAMGRMNEIKDRYHFFYPNTEKVKGAPTKAPTGSDLLLKKSNPGQR